jgi:hypothetical protein
VAGVAAELVPGAVHVGGRDREARRVTDVVEEAVLDRVADADVDPVPAREEMEIVHAHDEVLDVRARALADRGLHGGVPRRNAFVAVGVDLDPDHAAVELVESVEPDADCERLAHAEG